ncbi:MAG: hypothetical protein JWL97_4426 [Gemmatimonadales bacterium]|nr:hypothetical protein [Gemmatimonadales bacterium]
MALGACGEILSLCEICSTTLDHVTDPGELELAGRGRAIRLACAGCGRALTGALVQGEADLLSGDAGDAFDPQPTVPVGRFVIDPEPVAFLVSHAGAPQGVKELDPAGSLVVNPDDLADGAVTSTGWDFGCCGSAGVDGPNRGCRCGQTLGTARTDCWTSAEMRFHPHAVVVVEKG